MLNEFNWHINWLKQSKFFSKQGAAPKQKPDTKLHVAKSILISYLCTTSAPIWALYRQ